MAAPVVAARASGGTTTTDTTTHSIILPTGVTKGDLLLVFFSCDENPTISINTSVSGNNWNLGTKAAYSTSVSGVYIWKIAEGSDVLTLTTSVSQQSTHISFRITNGSNVASSNANGSSTNPNPPSLTPSWGSQEYLWIAACAGNSTVVASAAPTNFGNLQTKAASGTSGASASTAEYTFTTSAVDPAAFTMATTQWASFTIAILPKLTSAISGSIDPPKKVGDTVSDLFTSYNIGVSLIGQGNWIAGLGDVLVSSSGNIAPNATGAAECSAGKGGTWSSDQSAELTLNTASTDYLLGVCCRLQNSGGKYYLYYTGSGDRYCGYIIDGVYTELGSYTGGVGTGNTLKLEVIGDTITCYINDQIDTLLSGGGVYTNSAIPSGGVPGVSGYRGATSTTGGNWLGKNILSQVTGTLQQSVSHAAIAASISLNSSLSGNLRAKGKLGSSISLNSVLSGLIRAKGRLGSIISLNSSLNGLIYAKGRLGSSISLNSVLSGALRAKGKLFTSIISISVISSIIRGRKQITASISTSTTIIGNIKGKGFITSFITSTNILLGGLRSRQHILGNSISSTILTALIHAKGKLLGNSIGISSSITNLTQKSSLNSNVTSSTVISATLYGKGYLHQTINCFTSITGDLKIIPSLNCEISGRSYLVATLLGKGKFIISSNIYCRSFLIASLNSSNEFLILSVNSYICGAINVDSHIMIELSEKSTITSELTIPSIIKK